MSLSQQMQTLRSIFYWISHDKTVIRAMMNTWLETNRQSLSGNVYDLGGAGEASFKSIVKLPKTYVTVDMMAEAHPTIVADLEKTLPIDNGVADTVLLFNTIEHVYDFQHVANEMYRITKPGGQALVYSPFMVGVHTHKGESFFMNDYFRYSKSALDRIFRTAGYGEVIITPLGGLGWVIADLAMVAVRFLPLKVLVALVFGGFEILTSRFRNFNSAEKFPLGYVIEARRV